MAKKSKAQAKKPAKAAKASRVPKTKANAPGAAAVQALPGVGHNGRDKRTANEIQKGFIDHRRLWNNWMAKKAALEELEKEVKSNLKGDGYTVKQMQIADQLAGSAKASAKVEAEVKDRLQVARWINHPLGAQMDLFSQPDRTPAVDRARKDGKIASMDNKPCKPPHSPETEQYREWVAGWQEHQAEISKGFKKPNGDVKPTEAKPEPEVVTSGERVTSSEFKQRLADTTAQETDGSPKVH